MITLTYPVPHTSPVTQTYAEHVARGLRSYNGGIDFAVPTGTPVRAAADGIVMRVGMDTTGYGEHVRVLHDDGYMTLYAHLRAGKPAILGVDYIPWPNDAQYWEHYVLAYGLDDNDRILIADPLPDPAKGSNGYLCRRYGPDPAFATCRILLYELTGGNKP